MTSRYLAELVRRSRHERRHSLQPACPVQSLSTRLFIDFNQSCGFSMYHTSSLCYCCLLSQNMCLHCFKVPDTNKTWQCHQQRLFCLSIKVALTVIVYDKNRFCKISQWIMWWEVNSLWFIIVWVGVRWPFVRSWWENSLLHLWKKKKKKEGKTGTQKKCA